MLTSTTYSGLIIYDKIIVNGIEVTTWTPVKLIMFPLIEKVGICLFETEIIVNELRDITLGIWILKTSLVSIIELIPIVIVPTAN